MSKREEKRLWESLMAHPGWKLLESIADARCGNLASDVCRPMLEVAEALERNAKSGEIMGIHWVLLLPQQQAEMIDEDLKRMEAQGVGEDEEPTA